MRPCGWTLFSRTRPCAMWWEEARFSTKAASNSSRHDPVLSTPRICCGLFFAGPISGMNIGKYTFEEFVEKATAFHGYPAPGLLIGGYMVEAARAGLEDGVLFEAIVETPKCLPDAVQLLTLCSTGN